jgi:RNA recognition motif. (a.k.a. RRM, RBD, or RNP domain)
MLEIFSFSTTEPDQKDLFVQYGTVTDVHLVTDRMTGRSRGFACVTMLRTSGVLVSFAQSSRAPVFRADGSALFRWD